MPHDRVFAETIHRARTGDERAAEELLHRYLPSIKRYAGIRLNRAMRRHTDSLDVCQTVFGNFFIQLALGKFDLESPAQLIQLLRRMARNQLVNQVDAQQAGVRDMRRVDATPVEEIPIPAREATAIQLVIADEFLEIIRRRLSSAECRICDERIAGRSWEEIAEREGKSAEAIRKQHARAIERISRSLGVADLRS